MIKCRECGAEIDFVRTISGGNMPVDPDLVHHDELPDGATIVTVGGNTIRVIKNLRLPNVRGYIPHWASCTNAAAFRHKK